MKAKKNLKRFRRNTFVSCIRIYDCCYFSWTWTSYLSFEFWNKKKGLFYFSFCFRCLLFWCSFSLCFSLVFQRTENEKDQTSFLFFRFLINLFSEKSFSKLKDGKTLLTSIIIKNSIKKGNK